MKLTRQGVRDLDASSRPTVGLVVPATGPAMPAPAPRVENPDHDSLYAKFEQLEGLLEEVSSFSKDDVWIVAARKRRLAGDALALAREIRKQVLK